MKKPIMFTIIFSIIILTFIIASCALYGDVHKDNGVDSKDAVKLAQYLARWTIDFSAEDKKNADVHYDGEINAKDAVKLAQYLAGWKVTLGPSNNDVEVEADTLFGHPTDTTAPPDTTTPPETTSPSVDPDPVDGNGKLFEKLGLGQTIATDGKVKQAKVLENDTAEYIFSSSDIKNCAAGDVILFTFVMKADKATKITINPEMGTPINYQDKSNSLEYTVPAQWTKFYLPVENNGMEGISLTTKGKVYIGIADYENLGRVDIGSQELQLKSGMWMIDDFDSFSLSSADGISAGKTTGIIVSGDYIYSMGGGKFTVSNAKTKKVISTLSGFGTMRQMEMTEDGKYAIITGRQDGLYIVSLVDPEKPKILSSYNTIEQATGLCVAGDYAFVGNRTFGIEVVDISDPANPVHKGNIRSGEVQSCAVHNNIVYAGIWGECGVFMYDLANLENSPYLPMIGKVTTNGKGDGMSVIERDGRVYVLAATGHHLYDASYKDSLQNLAYGQGNGMDIYDVTDPANPIWVSTSKTDGRYYYNANDYWETEACYDAETDKWYAYLVNTYNGVYVYDVTDLSAPVRLTHVTIDLKAGSTPALTLADRTVVTSWDQSKTKRGPVASVVAKDGQLLIAGADSDIFVVDLPYAYSSDEEKHETTSVKVGNKFYEFANALTGGKFSSLKSGSYDHIKTTGQVMAAATNGNYLYIAAGSEGILVYNATTLEKLGRIAPSTENGRIGFALDVKVYGNKLFAAEDVAGLRVYDISGSFAYAPKLLSVYDDTKIVTQVTVASDGNFAVLHLSDNTVRVINTSSFDSATLKPVNILVEATGKSADRFSATGGVMYHHNLSPVIDDRYVVFWTHTGTEYWLDFGPAGSRLATPTIVSKGGTYAGSFKGGMSLNNGITSYEKDGVSYAIRIENKNARIQSDFSSYNYEKLFSLSITGKPEIVGDYMVLTNKQEGKIAFYRMDGTCLGVLTVNGNPDGAHTSGTKMYIPMGYQGLLIVDTATAFK